MSVCFTGGINLDHLVKALAMQFLLLLKAHFPLSIVSLLTDMIHLVQLTPLEHFLTFWHYMVLLTCIFPDLELAISARTPASFAAYFGQLTHQRTHRLVSDSLYS